MASDRPDIVRRSDRPTGSGPALPAREEGGLPREVYALLAQANLLRMRGRWEEAVGQCMAALRLAPDSSAAQSLLGDIYENQGRFDDAIQWYRMALDASPDGPADRLKLDRLLQRQTPGGRADRERAVEAVPGGERAAGPAVSARLWGRLTRDPEAALRAGALAAALLVCLVIAFAYASVHRRAALASLGFGTTPEVQTAPVEVAPVRALADPAGADGALRDAAEQAVLGTLRGSRDLSAAGVTVADVQFDPRAARMTIAISLPPGSGLTRPSVLRGALRAAQAGAAASPSATAFTLRALTTAPATGGGTLVFVGDLAQSALPAAGTAPADDDQVAALFTDPWWSPQGPAD